MAALVVIGCEEAAAGNGDERAALNPPAWLHGTWEYCVTAPGVLTWTFTAGNAVTVTTGVSTDFGAQAETMTVNESDGADWYQIDVPDAGVSYRFRARRRARSVYRDPERKLDNPAALPAIAPRVRCSDMFRRWWRGALSVWTPPGAPPSC